MREKKFKENVLKIILGGIAIFAFGIFAGYQLDNHSITSIQGFLYNAFGVATDSNATDSNATDSNATDSNATDSNATDSNATSGNAYITDNILFLYSFELGTSEIKPGEKVGVNITTIGACNSAASIVFKNPKNGISFTVSVNSISKEPYVIIPKNVLAGIYNVVEVMLIGENSDNSSFSRRYSSIDSNADYFVTDGLIDEALVIESSATIQEEKLVLNSFKLKNTESNINEKVYLDYKTNLNISSMKLSFNNSNGNEMVVYVKSLEENPYFEIPSNVMIGKYSLDSVIITSKDSTVVYSKDGKIENSQKYNFNSSIVINEVQKQEKFIYNNEDLSTDIITNLYNIEEDVTININADSKPIINEELFKTIKGTSKKLLITYNNNEMIFNGKDIETPKSIDVSISTSIISSDSEVGKLVNDGILLDFASNGNLPGNVMIRVKITEEMKNKFGNNEVYVYFYKKTENKFSEIATKIVPTTDGYYEFNIDHNSEYILVSKPLNKKMISTSDNNIVSFQKSNKVNLLLIGLGVVLIMVTGAIITIVRRKNIQKI